MITIKRYSNRKLYNTSAQQYVTLENISRLVRDGNDIKIIDHETGEDITATTLAQVILGRERKGPRLLSQTMLKRMIEVGESTSAQFRKAIFPYSSTAFKMELEYRIATLIQQEKLLPEEGETWKKALLEVPAAESEEVHLDDLFGGNEQGELKKDFEQLTDLVDQLIVKVEQMKKIQH